MNQFITQSMSNDAFTANGALSNSTSGSSLLDYFAKAGTYQNRTQHDVNSDVSQIFAEDETNAMRLLAYLRMVTRNTKQYGLSKGMNRGQGRRDEFIKALIWLKANRPEVLSRNLHMIPVVGRWSDLWYDSPTTGVFFYADVAEVAQLVKSVIMSGDQMSLDLMKKYLPKQRSGKFATKERHARKNRFIKNLCGAMGWTYKQYRQFKSSGEAHKFQSTICQKDWDNLDFNRIPGKVMSALVRNKNGQCLIEKYGQEKRFLEWLDKKSSVACTSYPHELVHESSGYRGFIQTHTLNKQFQSLLDNAKSRAFDRKVLCALDTSGSMFFPVAGKYSAYDICIGLGVYFSSLIQGHFKDYVVMFDSVSKFLQIKGKFCEKCDKIERANTAWGSTNFQSVIDAIVEMRLTNPQIPISDYPDTILVVSDMQFNPCKGRNPEAAKAKLEAVGLKDVKFIWWQVNGSYGEDVTTKEDENGMTMISGFDGSILANLLEVEDKVNEKGETVQPTPHEVMMNALSQEVLLEIK